MTREVDKDDYVYPGKRFGQSGLCTGEGQGMSLRDWFAGQALAGISSIAVEGFALSSADEAEWAYRRTDAMLAERAKK